MDERIMCRNSRNLAGLDDSAPGTGALRLLGTSVSRLRSMRSRIFLRRANAMVLIDGGLARRHGAATDPFYLHAVHGFSFSKAKMQGVGMLRTIGVAGHDLLDGVVVAGMKGHGRAVPRKRTMNKPVKDLPRRRFISGEIGAMQFPCQSLLPACGCPKCGRDPKNKTPAPSVQQAKNPHIVAWDRRATTAGCE